MTTARVSLILDILVEHHEELEFLWDQRRSALDDPDYSPRALADLDERIEAHVQGLLLAGEQLLPVVEQGLRGGATVAFAAAYPLLRLGREDAARLVLDAFLQAGEEPLSGLTWALAHGPITPILPQLREAITAAPPPIAVAAAEVLAFRSPGGIKPEALLRLLLHEAPAIRRAAWRVASSLKVPRSLKLYQTALQDEDPDVRRETLHAAAWGGQAWLLERLRTAARRPGPETLEELKLLAVLGGPEELNAIRAAGRVEALGPARFGLLGALGNPAVVDDLLAALTDPNPRVAVEAGLAFTRITGQDIASDNRVALPPEDGHEPDDFEKEFLDEAFLPDPKKARDHWQEIREQYAKGLRWCRGLEITDVVDPAVLDRLDLVSRREAYLRARFARTWDGCLADLERFPQQR